MEHKRKFERWHLIYYLKVTNVETNQVIGHAVNISNDGMMLISEKPIKPESLFQLKMFLPSEIQGSRYFEFSALSKWCKQDEIPDFFNTGFQLNNVADEGIQVIKRLIDDFCLN